MSKRMLAPRGTALKTLGCTCHVPEVATLSRDPAAPAWVRTEVFYEFGKSSLNAVCD